MSRFRLPTFLFFVLVLAALTACRQTAVVDLPTPAGAAATLPATSAATPEATATEAGPRGGSSTPTAIPPTVTAAPATVIRPGDATAAPTATPAPQPSPTLAIAPTATLPGPGGPMRFNFPPGGTSAAVEGILAQGGDTDVYLVRALAGQTMTVRATSSSPGLVVVSITDQTGGTLAVNADGHDISAPLPATGDYQVNLTTPSGAAGVNYALTVTIPPAGSQPPPQAVRISFPAGASSATQTGTLEAGGALDSYVLRVQAGQTLQAAVSANPAGTVTVYVRDTNGVLLSSGPDGPGGLSVPIPAAGDVFVDVGSFGAAPAVNYTLVVSVPPNPPTASPQQPSRIEFGPGQTTSTQTGTLPAGGRASTILRVLANQTLITNLIGNPAGQLDITIRDAAGTTLNFGGDPTELGTLIPLDGDYTIEIANPSAGAVGYTLVVTVPPGPQPGPPPARIEFAPGSISAVVNGSLAIGGDVDEWVIRALAGQTMTITVAPSEAGWMNLFVYNEGQQLIGSGTDQTGVAVPTTANGDYTILVSNINAGPAISYSMTVTIR